MFLMGYAIGQVAGPLTYKPTESPKCVPAFLKSSNTLCRHVIHLPSFPSGFLATTICLALDVILMCVYT